MAMSFVAKYAMCLSIFGPLPTEVEPVVNARVHVAGLGTGIAGTSYGSPGCPVQESPPLRMP